MCLLGTQSCMDDFDAPNTDNVLVTSPTDIGEVNSTILEVKEKFCANSSKADYMRNASNFYTKVAEDIIIEGVVCANDISGNLYQTLLLRNIDTTKAEGDAARDQSIIVGIKTTALYPYFRLGQRIKINLKGLYTGVYSKVPRIGQPTLSSYGNINLGAMDMELVKTNIQLVGTPDTTVAECKPIDLTDANGDAWLRASANKTYQNSPFLGIVRGTIKEYSTALEKGTATGVVDKVESHYTIKNGVKELCNCTSDDCPKIKIFAPYELHDDGYGVDRTIQLASNNSSVALRTSTKNRISYLELPAEARSYTGIMSYYDSWQVQLRDTTDISKN